MDINDYKLEIDNYLNNYFEGRAGYNDIIYHSQSYSLNIGGKRVRPILTLLVYSLYKDSYKGALKVACAIEMIHTYSLIHDDLPCMDDDDLRRGKKTNHKVFGENIAVLAGDALLNEAMIVIMTESLKYGKNYLEAGIKIAEAAGSEGMIGGQVVDILSEEKEDIEINELKYMHKKKTGELIKVSILAGAIMGDGTAEEIEKLNKFGDDLGLAFQIKDDILDIIGNEKKLGKKIHVDEKNNKTNYISKYGLEKSKEMCESLTNNCIEILKSLNKDTKLLEDLTLNLLKRDY
ncbi:polyprenyl synthetase family protein [uncultured Clostridium sp.]|uniref:polyprenyl synthetase family protein n=1 Tax=uncultured Clostridium sp. TaxID=59620 RepID=UPI0026211976|nr:farnesyl diphosphate synthase [uncultured Clostridium sp.]